MYKCNHCGKEVSDRHPFYDEQCMYSATNRHEFKQTDFSNDARWSESLVGRYWKWIAAAIILYFVLSWFGVFKSGESKTSDSVKSQNTETPVSAGTKDTLKSENDSVPVQKQIIEQTATETAQNPFTEYTGKWVGNFGNSEILLVIEEIATDGSVKGYNVVNENKRILKGSLSNVNKFELSEPGDEKWDGVFTFTVENNQANGTWTSNNGKLKKNYTLKKQLE